jgi:hypothetical protein
MTQKEQRNWNIRRDLQKRWTTVKAVFVSSSLKRLEQHA